LVSDSARRGRHRDGDTGRTACWSIRSLQGGTILRHHGSCALRYYDTEVRNGVHVRKKIFKQLAPVGPEYPNNRSVEPLAWKVLEPVNSGRLQPESSVLVSQFVEDTYLPFVKETFAAIHV
jgi:hypothetical protein